MQVTIEHTCTKEFLMQGEFFKDLTNLVLIPFLNSSNYIIGTQLVVKCFSSNIPKIYTFANSSEKSQTLICLLKSHGYKIYKDETNGEITAVMAYAKISDSADVR